MVSTMFLKIDGVKGESTDSNHKDEIELMSYSHGVSQPTSAVASTAGGGTSGRCNHTDLTVTKFLDVSSPVLNGLCCIGKHIDSVVLTLRRADGDKSIPYMVYKLKDVVISSVSVGGSSDQVPVETLTFNYSKIEWEYSKQARAKGGESGKTNGSWDLSKNASS
ncbi:MAG: type VI secretion system tube protein Hcp [Planctomycetes bacterium]|nr:type VI secretion system tube protein Hcp [Planctomycetota bacterium]MBZ0151967.1 type VI secretion system tube protein Hcp [Planctomycetota bacterium]MCC7398647.1 type VI secretion system tube protein Hcp [Planctomycetota bacterium]